MGHGDAGNSPEVPLNRLVLRLSVWIIEEGHFMSKLAAGVADLIAMGVEGQHEPLWHPLWRELAAYAEPLEVGDKPTATLLRAIWRALEPTDPEDAGYIDCPTLTDELELWSEGKVREGLYALRYVDLTINHGFYWRCAWTYGYQPPVIELTLDHAFEQLVVGRNKLSAQQWRAVRLNARNRWREGTPHGLPRR